MLPLRTILQAVCVLAAAGLAAAAAAGEIAARDALTGAPVAATLQWQDAGVTRTASLDGAPRRVATPATAVIARASAAGHHDLEFVLGAADGTITLLLDPLVPPAEFVALAARSEDREGRWLQGWVRDSHDGRAIDGAAVLIDGFATTSEADGYFELALPACPLGETARSTLEVSAAGFPARRIDGVPCTSGIERRVLALGAGLPVRTTDGLGALDRLDGSTAAANLGEALDALTGSVAPRAATSIGVLVAGPLAPPGSIRVGFNDAACTVECCGTSCSKVCVKSLETYVRNGLPREWIASWAQDSLRAGSIAYRSYGAWHVDHPKTGSYDICSSACCQVNGNTTASSTDAAIARTPGILLSRDGASAFRAEYSAENNSWKDPDSTLSCSNADLSCGDGYAGSPATGWPCLADPVSAGRSCFGHGRGMSQWGTQRWATDASGHRWPWIVDHYYNANGAGADKRTAVMTSPLGLAGVHAVPASVAPGETFTIHATASNTAGAVHAHLLIGASLWRSGQGFVNDSAHDALLGLPVGSHATSRTFTVPAGTAAGDWDLWVSLYLDADENGAISGSDLALALVTVPAALRVVSDRIFADGFENPE